MGRICPCSLDRQLYKRSSTPNRDMLNRKENKAWFAYKAACTVVGSQTIVYL